MNQFQINRFAEKAKIKIMSEVLAKSTKTERKAKLLNDISLLRQGSSIKAILRELEKSPSRIAVLASPKGRARKKLLPVTPEKMLTTKRESMVCTS